MFKLRQSEFWVIISGVLDTFLIEKSFYWGFSFPKGNYTVRRCPAGTNAECANMFSERKGTYGACHLPLFQITPQKINLWSQITVITVSWNISFTCFCIYLFCMCVEERFGGCKGKQMPQYSPAGQNTTHRSPLSSFSMWVSGIECRSPGCAESIPTIDPSLQLFSMI